MYVSMNMYICVYMMYVCACVYLYMYVYMYACMGMYICMCMFICMWVYGRKYECVYMYVYHIHTLTYTHTYVSMYACLYVCVYVRNMVDTGCIWQSFYLIKITNNTKLLLLLLWLLLLLLLLLFLPDVSHATSRWMLQAMNNEAMEWLMDRISIGSGSSGIRDVWSKWWIREQGTEIWLMQDWIRVQVTVILFN